MDKTAERSFASARHTSTRLAAADPAGEHHGLVTNRELPASKTDARARVLNGSPPIHTYTHLNLSSSSATPSIASLAYRCTRQKSGIHEADEPVVAIHTIRCPVPPAAACCACGHSSRKLAKPPVASCSAHLVRIDECRPNGADGALRKHAAKGTKEARLHADVEKVTRSLHR